MKKLIALMALALTLTACGGDQKPKETKEEVKQEEVAKDENKKESKEETKEVKEETQEANKDDVYSYAGKTYKDGGTSIDVIKAGRVDKTFKIGPLNLTVYGVMTGRITEFNEELKAYYDTEDPVDVVTIYLSLIHI